MNKSLNQWQTENAQRTKQRCEDLLSQLKRKHLDPVLQQLRGTDGSKLSFDDIIGVYHLIKDDYDARAVGAKDAIAAAFFDYHPVRNRHCFIISYVKFILNGFVHDQIHKNKREGKEDRNCGRCNLGDQCESLIAV